MPGARPRIGEGENAIEPVAMRCDYQLPWNRQSTQTACGNMIQKNAGSESWRIVIEGVMTKEHLKKLVLLREESKVPIITEEFGRIIIDFDQLSITRADEEKWGEIEGVEGPFLSFQLQTKENTNDGEDNVTIPG